jgi:phytoene dehydrogenase-like protein
MGIGPKGNAIRNDQIGFGTPMRQHGNEYGAIIVGSGLGGLVAGILLLKKNYEVLLLKEKKYHPSFEKEGYRFIPFSSFSERHLNINFLKKISQLLNFPLKSQDRGKDKAFQVILPSARIDFFYHRPFLSMEWEREFPEEAAQIENFFNDMDHLLQDLKALRSKEGAESIFPIRAPSMAPKWFSFPTFPKGGLDERLASFSQEFREFIQLQLISWGSLWSNQFPLSLAAYLLLNHKANEGTPPIHLEWLRKTLFEKFFQSGGMMEEVEGVEEVKKEWRKGFFVSLKGREQPVQSKFLILNSPLQGFSNHLVKKIKKLTVWEEKIKPRYVLLPLFLGVREKVIPVGMKESLVSMLDLNKPYGDGNILFIALSPKGEETEAPAGRRALTVENLIPIQKWDQIFLMYHQKEVLNHLNHLFPFLEKNIEFMDWNWGNEQYSSWSYPHIIYEASADFQWREGVVPSRIAKNLYFIGKENFPYLGLEGEVLSGLLTAQQFLQKSS